MRNADGEAMHALRCVRACDAARRYVIAYVADEQTNCARRQRLHRERNKQQLAREVLSALLRQSAAGEPVRVPGSDVAFAQHRHLDLDVRAKPIDGTAAQLSPMNEGAQPRNP